MRSWYDLRDHIYADQKLPFAKDAIIRVELEPRKTLEDLRGVRNKTIEECVRDAPSLLDKYGTPAAIVLSDYLIRSKVVYRDNNFVAVMPGKGSLELPLWVKKTLRFKLDGDWIGKFISLYW